MADQEINASILRNMFETSNISIDSEEWKDDGITNIALTLRGRNDKLERIESLLCDASHARLKREEFERIGLLKGLCRLKEPVTRFLNEYTEIVTTDYQGLGRGAEYLIELDSKNRMFVALKYK
jgi:hypothetical protein